MWHHDINKPVSFGIHKHSKPHHYLDDTMRVKKGVPGPTAYNVVQGLEQNKNIMHQRAPRHCFPQELQNQNKKDNFPGPTSYKLEWRRLSKEKRIPGQYAGEAPRAGYLEEIQYLAKIQPAWKHYNKNYSWVDPKPKAAAMHTPLMEEKPITDQVAPTSYDFDTAFKKSQLPNMNGYLFERQKRNLMICDPKERTSHLS